MTRVTLKDVAVHAGVSHQTVSNVLNGHPSLRPATRERVLAAIEVLDYHPNQAAKALREARVTTLCCVFHEIDPEAVDDPYRNLIQSAFIAEAQARGYSMSIAFLNDRQPELMQALRHQFRQRRFGGIVIVGATLTGAQWQELSAWNVPAVLCDHTLPGTVAPSITADYQGGMEALVAHHVSSGRKRLALILPRDHPSSTAQARLRGFLQATAACETDAVVVSGDWTFESGRQAMHQLWSRAGHPDAVLAGNDRMAAGAMRAAHDLGLRIPEDVAISGFDNFDFARYTTPTLTSVDVSHARMARLAVRSLLSQLEDGKTSEPVTLPARLVIRESA